MLDIQRCLDQSSDSTANLSTYSRFGHGLHQESLSHRTCEPINNDNSPTKLFTKPMGRLIEDKENVLGSLYLGPTSLETLMLEMGDYITTFVDSDSRESTDAVGSICDKINTFVEARHQRSSTGTASPPTEPPLVILEGMIEPYFSKINPGFPIWSRDGFQKMVDSLHQHSRGPEFKWASIVCCNNLILINLTMDAMHSIQQRMSQSGQSRNIPSMGSDLVTGFLANSKRAIDNLGPLSPGLINVQALLSLVRIAIGGFQTGLSKRTS